MKKLILIVTSILMCVSMYAQEQPITPNLAATPVVQDIGVVQLMDKYFTQISNLVKSAEQPIKDLYAGLIKQVQVNAKINVFLFLILWIIFISLSSIFYIKASKAEWSMEDACGEVMWFVIIFGVSIGLFTGMIISIRNCMIICSNPEWFALKELLSIISN